MGKCISSVGGSGRTSGGGILICREEFGAGILGVGIWDVLGVGS